jgi:hypothetical protein
MVEEKSGGALPLGGFRNVFFVAPRSKWGGPLLGAEREENEPREILNAIEIGKENGVPLWHGLLLPEEESRVEQVLGRKWNSYGQILREAPLLAKKVLRTQVEELKEQKEGPQKGEFVLEDRTVSLEEGESLRGGEIPQEEVLIPHEWFGVPALMGEEP